MSDLVHVDNAFFPQRTRGGNSNPQGLHAVRSLDDIQGMDLRASCGAAQILKAWGANQVGMPMSATPEVLQKGVVQGLFSSLEVMKDLKFAESCKYVTMTDTVIYPFAVVMNMDRWNALPPEVQKVIEDMGTEQAEWTGSYMDQHVKDSMEWSVKEQKVDVIALDAATKKVIEYGKRIRTCLKQKELHHMSVPEQIMVLLSLKERLFDNI